MNFFFPVIAAVALSNPLINSDRLSIFTFEPAPLFNDGSFQKIFIHPEHIGFTHNSILVRIEGEWFSTRAIFADEHGLFIQVKVGERHNPFRMACINSECEHSVCPTFEGRCPFCRCRLIHTFHF